MSVSCLYLIIAACPIVSSAIRTVGGEYWVKIKFPSEGVDFLLKGHEVYLHAALSG